MVLALGGVLVVLGMGMASIHSALALFYLVRERLPSRAPLALVLPRRGARIDEVKSGDWAIGGQCLTTEAFTPWPPGSLPDPASPRPAGDRQPTGRSIFANDDRALIR